MCLLLYCTDVGHLKVEEQQQPNISDDSSTDTVPNSGIGKNVINEDDLKASYTIDSPVCCLYFSLVNHSIVCLLIFFWR